MTSHMQEVQSQKPAADLGSIAPPQEQSSQKNMQDGQCEQDPRVPVPVPGLCYLPPFGQGLLQIYYLCLTAAELHLRLLSCLREPKYVSSVQESFLSSFSRQGCPKV